MAQRRIEVILPCAINAWCGLRVIKRVPKPPGSARPRRFVLRLPLALTRITLSLRRFVSKWSRALMRLETTERRRTVQQVVTSPQRVMALMIP